MKEEYPQFYIKYFCVNNTPVNPTREQATISEKDLRTEPLERVYPNKQEVLNDMENIIKKLTTDLQNTKAEPAKKAVYENILTENEYQTWKREI